MVKITLCILAGLITAAGPLYPQAVLFTGGPGSGAAVNQTAYTTCPQFPGGNGSGSADGNSPFTACSFFRGGINDGAAFQLSDFTFCPQFPGGAGDGASENSSGCLTILPARRFVFYGTHETNSNVLFWKAETGYAIREFQLEKSTTGNRFDPLATITGNTDPAHLYSFTDNNLTTDANFYRIRITEQDLRVSYSNILLLKGINSSLLSVFPNPSYGSSTVYYYATASFSTGMRLTDLYGRQLASTNIAVRQGANYFSLDLNQYAAGMYVLKIGDQSVKILLQPH